MKLLTARVQGTPRSVNTKYGEKSVMDVLTDEGDTVAIWRPAGDMEVLGRRNGERVTISVDSKGKISLVETGSTGLAAATLDRPLPTSPVPVKSIAPKTETVTETETIEGFLSPSQKRDIAGYVTQMADLFNFCLSTVDQRVQNIENEDRRAIATTLYLSTQKQFGL